MKEKLKEETAALTILQAEYEETKEKLESDRLIHQQVLEERSRHVEEMKRTLETTTDAWRSELEKNRENQQAWQTTLQEMEIKERELRAEVTQTKEKMEKLSKEKERL